MDPTVIVLLNRRDEPVPTKDAWVYETRITTRVKRLDGIAFQDEVVLFRKHVEVLPRDTLKVTAGDVYAARTSKQEA